MNFRRRTSFLLFCCTLFALTVITAPVMAQFSSPGGGVDDSNGVFQLEGNATTDSGICFKTVANGGPSIATPGPGNTCPPSFTFVAFGTQTDDWANVNTGGTSFHGLATTGIVTDTINSTSDNIFTGGGSKDTIDIPSWLWKSGKPQGKDDIEHAFAAAYTLPNGHTAIYFGLDRFDNSGDSTAGFWFFQDSTVGLGGASGGGGTHFTGSHRDGDLLIVSDFSTGGTISSIAVYKWVASAGTIQLVTSIPGAEIGECDPTTGSKDLCAIVNPVGGLASPWGFVNKAGQTTFDHGELLEGSLDLNAIFTTVPCFTTFMAETRSSTSPTATLSDFSPPVSFPLCGLGVTKACNGNTGTVSADGTSVTYTWTVTATNTGIGTLYNVEVEDTFPDGTKQTYPVGTLSPKASGSVMAGPFVATDTNCHAGVTNCPSPLDVTNTATAKGFTASSGGTEVDSSPPPATNECKTSVSAMLSITKHCDASKGGATLVARDGVVQVEVFYTAQVCNTTTPGSGTQLTNITLLDTDGAGVNDTPSPSTISSLNPGQCTTVGSITGSYLPSTIDSTTGRYGFSDTIRVTGATATLGSPPAPVVGCPGAKDLACSPVTCPICFDSVCTGSGLP